MPRDLLAEISPINTQQQPRDLLAGEPSAEQESTGREGFGGALINALLGAGYQAGKVPTGILRAVGYPSVNPLQQEADRNKSMAFNVGRVGGGILSAAPAAMAASMAAPSIPFLGTALSAAMKAKGIVPAAIRGGLGGAAYGGTTDYEDRLGGAMEGGAYGAGGGALAGALASVGRVLPFVGKGGPVKQTEKLLNDISVGNKFEDTSSGLLSKLKTNFEHYKSSGSKLYDPIMKKIGNEKITTSSYENALGDVESYLGRDVKKIQKAFMENPTFKNAHEYQSQLGSEIRSLSKAGKADQASRNELSALKDAKKAVLEDMKRHANSKGSYLADKYSEASKYYAEHVAPYIEDKAIAKIAKGEITSLDSNAIKSIFGFPESGVKKIAMDLGEKDINRMLYLSHLGKSAGKITPQKLLEKAGALEEMGLGSYVTPSLQKQLDALGSSLEKTDLLKSNLKKAAGLGSLLIGGKMVKNYLPDIWG